MKKVIKSVWWGYLCREKKKIKCEKCGYTEERILEKEGYGSCPKCKIGLVEC